MARRILVIEVDDEILTGEMGTAATDTVDQIRRKEFGRSMREAMMQEQYSGQHQDAAAHLKMFFGVVIKSDEVKA